MNHNELPCLDLFFLSLLMNQNYIPYIVLAVLDSVYIYDHKKKKTTAGEQGFKKRKCFAKHVHYLFI